MMFNKRIIRQLASLLFAVLVVLVLAQFASACPTCKDGIGDDPATANLARGYGLSIVFMMSMPFLILTGLSAYFYYEVCKARAVQALNAADCDTTVTS
jgi:hypothetical protein